jgi:hypothetical protein
MLAVLAVAPGFAQTAPALRVSLPFEFTVNNTTMPAGEYWIGDSGLPGASLLAIRSSDSQHSVFFTASAVVLSATPDQSTVAFDRYGGRYFLRSISWASHDSGAELAMSKTEKELSKTASARRPEQVTLMASR